MNSKYIAIAVTTECNLKCPYCQSTGESIPNVQGMWNYNRLKEILTVFLEVGYRNFRITGGEPTTFPYLGELLDFLLQDSDVRVRINTNGYAIEKYIDHFSSQTEIIFSVDGLKNVFSPKRLTDELLKKIQYLQSRDISIRLNCVVTKQNAYEISELIQFCSEKGLNLKLLDLSPRAEYQGKIQNDFWNNNYFELNKLSISLSKVSSDFRTDMIKKGTGIPMSGYSLGNGHWLQIKDSSKGPYYASVCNNCPYKDNCTEGVFSLSLSVGEILRVANCVNQDYWVKLNGLKQRQIKEEVKKMENLFFSNN